MTRDRILVVRKLITESLLTVIYMYHTETLLYRSFKKAGQKKTKIWMIVSSLYILLKSLLSYERRMFHTLPKILRQQATKNLFYNFRITESQTIHCINILSVTSILWIPVEQITINRKATKKKNSPLKNTHCSTLKGMYQLWEICIN